MDLCEKVEADVVVIGGGGAGIAAAIAAAEKRANVVVLEKRGSPGGNSVFPAGPFAAESPVQKRFGVDAPRDAFFKEAMKYSHWRLNPRIIRAYIDKTGDTIRWLEEKGVEFTGLRTLYPTQKIPVWHMIKDVGARHLFKVLLKNCEELGVKVLRRTAAKKILTDEKGRITGVLASTKEKEIIINTKSVIIATGGYGGNKELLKKYHPNYHENMYNCGLPHMGDGLLMAIEIGAATDGLGIIQLNGPRVPGSNVVTRIAQNPDNILVNKKGERFVDETLVPFPELGNAVDRQPEKIVYAVFDEKIKQSFIERWVEDYKMEMPSVTMMKEEFQRYMDKGYVKSSNSWDEIAEWMGVDPEALKTTINEYNSFCDNGHDEIFVKDKNHLVPLRTPPYYAIKTYSGYYNTIGGIKINHHMEVLDKQDRPIPGLYAAGVDVGGWETETYNANLSGSTFSFALNSGRIAGENAADYVAALKT
ncbi:MAG: FAD-dependent oxidoreductase [Candidatus Bathyarchaeia archaeon]